ncbi:MAG: Ig-like domain-containing protein, partial [Chlorobiaceae bacterium]
MESRTTTGGDNRVSNATIEYFLDGGTYVAPPTSLADVVVDLMSTSDSGTLDTDNITNITLPTVTVYLTGKTLIAGHILQVIDTSYSNAVVGTYTIIAQDASGLASKDIKLSNLSGGAHALKAQFSTSSGTLGTPSTTATTVMVDTTVPTTTISALTLSADTGTSGTDFITKTASQTISGTLSAVTVAGEVVKVSIDNGTTWMTATNTIGQNSFSVSGVTLTGSNTLKVQVEDAAGNASTAKSQVYVLDTTSPGVSTVTDGTAASVTKDAITFTVTFDEAVVGTVGTSSFTATNGTVNSVTSAGGNAYTVVVSPTVGMASGNVALSLVGTGLTDAAGNTVVSANLSGKDSQGIDTLAPTTTVSGLVLSADTGTSGTDFITKTALQTISGTLSAVTVAGDVVKVSLDNGATWTTATNIIGENSFSMPGVTLTGSNTLKVQVEDAAGNVGVATSQAYVLDTVVPTTTISTLVFSADTGTISTDFITKTASQTISGTLSAVTV